MEETMFKLGAIPSKKDERDYSIKVKLARLTPFEKEFTIPMFAHYRQRFGTCVAQSWRSLLRKLFGIEFGVNTVYAAARASDRDTPGLHPNEAANFICAYGMPRLIDDPSELEMTEARELYLGNSNFYLSAAAAIKGGTWARIHTPDELKTVLSSGLPVLVCLGLSTSVPHKTSFILDFVPANIFGYHEVLIIGWKEINGVDYFRIFNSWGEGWGMAGDCYISWEQIAYQDDLIVYSKTKNNIYFTIQRTLKVGHTGEDVTEAQNKLIKLGFPCGPKGADGVFGVATRDAVIALQKQYQLTVNGYVTQEVWKILDAVDDEPDPEPEPLPKPEPDPQPEPLPDPQPEPNPQPEPKPEPDDEENKKDINLIEILVKFLINLIKKILNR